MSPGTHTTCLGCLPGFRNPHLVSKQNILFSIFILTSNLYTLCNTRSDGLTSFFSNSCWHPFGYVSLFSLLFRFPNAKYLAISRYRHKHISDLTLPPSPLPGGAGGGGGETSALGKQVCRQLFLDCPSYMRRSH